MTETEKAARLIDDIANRFDGLYKGKPVSVITNDERVLLRAFASAILGLRDREEVFGVWKPTTPPIAP
jgi:cobalamin biosynthesis Co2+ chelatase CbiK